MRLNFRPIFVSFLMALTFSNALASEECTDCPPPPPPASDSPFDPGSCVGNTLSAKEAADLFCRGASEVNLGKFLYQVRYRKCNHFTGCSDWLTADSTFLGMQYSDGNYRSAPKGVGGTFYLKTTSTSVYLSFEAAVLSDYLRHQADLPSACTTQVITGRTASSWGTGVLDSGQNHLYDLAAQLTEHCGRFITTAKSPVGNDGGWREYEVGGAGSVLSLVRGYLEKRKALHDPSDRAGPSVL